MVVICTLTAFVIIFYNMGGVFEYGGDSDGNVMINGFPIGGVNLPSLAFASVIPWFPYGRGIICFSIDVTDCSSSVFPLESPRPLPEIVDRHKLAYNDQSMLYRYSGVSLSFS